MKLPKLLLFLLISLTVPLFADDASGGEPEKVSVDNSNEDAKRFTSSRSISLTISSIPEAKVAFSQNLTFPLLQGKSPLTSGNNIGVNFNAEVTPISLNGIVEAVWTPIAFFQIVAGARLGSGWNIKLFGSDVYGIGINKLNGDGQSTSVVGRAFDGLLWKLNVGGVFQFDMAAVLPGDWHHVVFRTYHEINYAGYTKADKDDSWYFENDDGENRNGFNYYGNFLLGYQMPIFLNTVGVLVEVDKYLYNTPHGSDWGDALGRWHFSLLFDFTVTKWFDIALITQLETRRWSKDDEKNVPFYQNRTLSDPRRYVKPYRIAAILSFKLP
jgi:hypothetical protein